MTKKELRERVKLLEHENKIIIKKLKKLMPLMPVNENEIPDIDTNTYLGVDPMGYDTLRRKYRKHTIKFDDEL